MTEIVAGPSQNMGGFRLLPLPTPRDRFLLWPSALAVSAVGLQIALQQTIDLRDHVGSLWLALFVVPLLCVIFVLSILWIGSTIKYLFRWRWRRLMSGCVAPVIIVAALRPVAIEYDPLHRFISSRALEARASTTGLPSGQHFAALDISCCGFVPPLTLLIYDETDQIGLRRDRHSAPLQTRGSKSDRSIMSACSGVSEYVLRHYYICSPQVDTFLPIP